MLVSKKKFNEKLEHLLGSLKFYKNRKENTLKIIENKNGDSLSCMGSLATIYEITASKVLLVDKDNQAYIHFYLVPPSLSLFLFLLPLK